MSKSQKLIALHKGFAINNDTVTLEEGHKHSLIKKSCYAALVEAIELVAQQVGQNITSPTQQVELAKNKIKAVKSDYEQLKEDYEILLEKCNSLLLENFELKQKTHL